MPSTVLWFATEDFVDSDEEREQRVNEDIGGAALAKWLSTELQAKGLRASAPWPEDHGWDFSVESTQGAYAIVCTIEDGADEERQACVQIHLGKPGRAALQSADPVLRQIIAMLEGRGAIIAVE